jgi:ferredoxin/flavodoxin---NADP+ reductase
MHKIISAGFIAPGIKRFEIEAPKIALKRQPGQFVIIRVEENGERIPLTIADSNIQSGTITIIVQGIGKTTTLLNQKEGGDFISDVVGPLGKPSHIDKFGTAISIGGGVGTAIAYPTSVALKQAGNHTISIIGGRSKEFVILEDEMKKVSDEVYVTTDDGSYGFHGFVTDKLKEIIEAKRQIDFVLAIGPIPMMKAVAEVTKVHRIKTMVSLNPVMVDGTGMCGGCRATVNGKTVFVCVDGPEFDAHKVDFDTLDKRNRTYRKFEETAYKNLLCQYEQYTKAGVELT